MLVNDLQSNFRIPDFIAPDFIAESKNTQNLLYSGREYDQISDYALAAKLLNRPLWVYTRVDTIVEPKFYEIVHATGGNVVPYFTVPGYVDPVDDAARKVRPATRPTPLSYQTSRIPWRQASIASTFIPRLKGCNCAPMPPASGRR